MTTSVEPKRLSPFGLFNYSIRFIGTHFLFVFGGGLIAAIGRAIQLGALYQVSGGVNALLEVVIETARILTFLLVVGEGSTRDGVQRIRSIFFLNRAQWMSTGSMVLTQLKVNWIALLINLAMYGAVAFLFNFLIDQVAYATELLTFLQHSRILAPQSSEWVLLLFFKNLTVIPFTIIFDGLLLLWVTNNLSTFAQSDNSGSPK